MNYIYDFSCNQNNTTYGENYYNFSNCNSGYYQNITPLNPCAPWVGVHGTIPFPTAVLAFYRSTDIWSWGSILPGTNFVFVSAVQNNRVQIRLTSGTSSGAVVWVAASTMNVRNLC